VGSWNSWRIFEGEENSFTARGLPRRCLVHGSQVLGLLTWNFDLFMGAPSLYLCHRAKNWKTASPLDRPRVVIPERVLTLGAETPVLYKGQAFSRSTEPGWLNLILDEGLVHSEKPRQVATLVCRNFVIRDVWLKRTKKCKSK